MAITANISLKSAFIVLVTPPKYQLLFNVNAQSSFDITNYNQYVDGVLVGYKNLSNPTKTFSDTSNPYYADGIGWHFIEIEMFNSNGESIRVGTRIYLDLTNPILNNFALNRVGRNSSNDYVVYFDIDISDDSGISRTTIINASDGTTSEVLVPLSTNDYRAEQTIIIPGNVNNVTKYFYLEYADYSGNSVRTSVPVSVFFTNTPPLVSNVKINNIVQTANTYEITVDLTTTFASYQNIAAYSIKYEDPNPTWISTFATGGTAVITDTISVPKTEPAGTKTIYASVKDNYENASLVGSTTFQLDKLKPYGNVNLDYAEKIGANYYANIHFTATDSGLISAYSYNTISPTVNYWNLVTPTQTFSEHKILNLGSNGQRNLYVRYRDFSGNLSDVYTLPIDIDTISPDCSFTFDHGEVRTDGDYNAYFNLLGVDNTSIDFIKLFGVNANTGNIVSGQSNTWVRIPSSTQSYAELRPIVIPVTEQEDNITFYFQVRDLFGNDSPVRTTNVLFDKTPPVLNSLTYNDVIKTATNYRIFADFQATDDKGIVAYRFGFDDITIQPWEFVTKTLSLNETVYLEVPISEIGVAKSFDVQVKDLFGNYSNVLSIPIQVDTQPPIGSITFVGGGLTATDYTLDFRIDATDPNNDVYWYSLEIDDPTITNWKKLNTPGLSVSEVKQLLLPRTSNGRHNFYLKFADIYKNESPIYNLEYDLDSINTVGGLSLHDIEKTPSTYNANVELYAFDNRKVKSYIIDGGPETVIVPAVQSFTDHIILPIGLSAGPKTITVQYKDTFDNLSDVYTLNFNLDNTDPFANVYFTGATSNASSFFLNFDLNMTDDQELYEYKFWYLGTPEPYNWTKIPLGQTSVTVNETFTIPTFDLFPGFKWKVRDFFENEYSNTEYKIITNIPPTINNLTVSNITYGLGGSNVEVSYDVTADTGSTVDRLEVIVNEVGTANLDFFTVDVYPNAINANNKFYYNFPLNVSTANFKVRARSDYGYVSGYTIASQSLDNVKPLISNTTFIGSFSDNSDYILQFRIEGTDGDSGIRKIKANVLTYPTPTSTTYTVSLTNTIDEIVNLRVTGAHISNSVDVTFTLIDLLNNESLPSTITNIQLDRTVPTISSLVLNGGKTYTSSLVGANTNIVDVQFTASDVSTVTHYKYSKNITETFNNTWSATTPAATSVTVTDTINLDSLGFLEGNNVFFVHVKDRFGNIATDGVQFEYDKTPPSFTANFSNYIEREVIAGTEYFVIPYNVNYTDNYSEIKFVYENHSYGGNSYPVVASPVIPSLTANNYIEKYRLPVDYYGDTKITVSLEDRFENRTSEKSFNVFLENIPPTIKYAVINNGAKYTTQKDVYIRMDLEDDSALSDSLFSNTSNVVWNTPGWTPIPYGLTTSITNSFLVDLEAIGFDQGTCNVHCFIKDFCQNISNTAQTIIYDYEPPVVVDFKVNNIIRSINTFDVEMNAFAYDITSGLDTYYISNNKDNKVYDTIAGGPIIGTTPILFTETKKVSVKDGGWKTYYFQATDAAGNISVQANTQFYIDSLAPVAAFFQPTSTISKYYLNSANNEFEFIVSDDYALESIEYQIDSSTINTIKTFDPSNNIIYDANTFNANFAGLMDGEHTIYLTVLDSFQNRVRVPYEFHYDNTAPIVSTFDIKEIQPVGSNTYDVEFNIHSYDIVGIKKYELYDNDNLVAEDTINDLSFMKTPTLKTQLNTFDSNLNIALVLIEDFYGTTFSNGYVLVQNYTGTSAEDDLIVSYLKNNIGIPSSEINVFLPLGNDIDVIQQTQGSLTNEIPSLNLTTPPLNTSYEVIQFYASTGSTTVPTSTTASYIKNNNILFAEDTTPGQFIEYSAIWVTDYVNNVSVHKELHEYTLKVYDYAENVNTSKIQRFIHDGVNLNINSFTVDSVTTILTNALTSVLFESNITSDVNIIEYAFSIQPSLDFNNALWIDFTTPNSNTNLSEVVSLENFSLNNSNSTSVYLHVKDDSGNITSSMVTVVFTTNNPKIMGINSPVTLSKQGNYYIGELVINAEDDNNQIEAYAIGLDPDPKNFKSIPLLTSGTITQQFKIPENEINGSEIVYVKLRDVDGNESLTYRISVRALDFSFDKFEILADDQMAGNGNVRVLYDTDSNPTQLEYGYKIDDSNQPTVWYPILLLNQNNLGEYYFDFNLDVSSINVGKHDLYVWLKSKEGEKLFAQDSFVSEQSAVAPFATLSVYKTKFEEGKKKVWVEANIFDTGVGVKQICFDEDTNPDVFNNINIVQNKRILKLFEYDATDNSSITYKLKLIDAVNTPSLTYNATVNLSYVY